MPKRSVGIAALVLALSCAAAYAEARVSWDWQLSSPFDLDRGVAVMDIDPDNHTAADIATLNARGIKTICYVSVGTLEDYRDDVAAFPAALVGKTYGAWPDEAFLDIRRVDVLVPLMQTRFARCREMGFAAVEPDNMDVYINDSGFPITAADTVAYVEALADIAHGMGLEIGQKNVPELTAELVDTLDFIVTEDCFADGWCADAGAYAARDKPIFAAEYADSGVDFAAACAYGAEAGMSFILKDRDLTRSLETCP